MREKCFIDKISVKSKTVLFDSKSFKLNVEILKLTYFDSNAVINVFALSEVLLDVRVM